MISVLSHRTFKNHPAASATLGVIVGAVIMVIGYSLGRAFIYSTPEYALIKLPYQVAQAVIGAVFSLLICFKCGFKKLAENYGFYYEPILKK